VERPNILLLVLDTLRADAVEPYGAPPGASPAIAGLAARGLAVPGVRATASWTLPSHASMFTGRLSRELGLGQAPAETPPSARPVVQAQRERLLAHVLGTAGYQTGGVTTNMWAGSMSGFDTGFDRFVDVDSSRQGRLDGGTRARLRWGWEAVARGDLDDGAAEAGKVLEAWIGAAPPAPFFWFVNLVEAHSPYLPPRPYDRIGRLGRLRAAEDARRYLTLSSIMRVCAGALEVPEPALELMRALYAGSVRYLDDWVARLLEQLEGAGLLDGTLVIVTSDHGENLGENGLLAHTASLDERLIHVPFVAAGPGARELDGMRSLIELPARLARVAGLADHPWGDPPAGDVAVAQWDPPTDADDPRIQGFAARFGLDDEEIARLSTPQTCATDGRYKLLRRGAGDELYDLAADPVETAPVTAPRPEAQDAMRRLRDALDDPRVSATPSSSDVASAASDASDDEVADIERRMKLMGYM
jgi:arylsulfatase A-like enzyme